MTLKEICSRLDLGVRTASASLDREVTGGYVGDLMSDVVANAREGNVWITVHRYPNVVAVAVTGGPAGVILVNGREPEKATLERAEEEGIPLLVSSLLSFELVGRMHGLGISGQKQC